MCTGLDVRSGTETHGSFSGGDPRFPRRIPAKGVTWSPLLQTATVGGVIAATVHVTGICTGDVAAVCVPTGSNETALVIGAAKRNARHVVCGMRSASPFDATERSARCGARMPLDFSGAERSATAYCAWRRCCDGVQ